MSNNENMIKSGHPVLGLVLGLLGCAIALLLTILTGAIGGGIAALLGIIALILGIKARKSGRGIGAIITGVLAIVLAVFLTLGTIGSFITLKEKADELGTVPLISKYMDKPYLGIVGMALSIPSDEGTLQQFTDEMNEVIRVVNSTTKTTTHVTTTNVSTTAEP